MKRSLDQMNGGEHASPDDRPTKQEFQQDDHSQSSTAAGGADSRTRIKKKGSACTECRKVKMKCEPKPGMEICARCAKNGLECVFNKSMQSLLTQDHEWKMQFREELDQLRDTVNSILNRIDSSPTVPKRRSTTTSAMSLVSPNMAPPGISPGVAFETPASNHSHISQSNQAATGMNMTRENSPETPEASKSTEAEGDEGERLVAAPMGSLYEVTKLRNIRNKPTTRPRPLSQGDGIADEEIEVDDFISRGLISLEEGEELYEYFLTSLNHYLWVHIESNHTDLMSVRRSSSLLAACILTAAALHLPNKSFTFDRLYSVFCSLVQESMFDRFHSLDDIRAMCLGAFWFSDASWKLSGHSIRIATELGLHNRKIFLAALAGNKEQYERARLWYVLYVCDHHFSFAYGRPCLIRESYQIRNHEEFLKSPFALPIDFRILSQVSIFQIMSKVDEAFEGRLTEECLVKVEGFNAELDKWLILWQKRQKTNAFIGDFPPLGNLLYYHFTKLQLNSLVLRDINREKVREFGLTPSRKKFANMAIASAISTLTDVLDKRDVQRALVGGPLYILTMVAFAAVFLLKLATKWKHFGLEIDNDETFMLVERTQRMLMSTVAGEKHLVYYIAAGLDKMLKKFRAVEARETSLTDMEMSNFWDSVMGRAWGGVGSDGNTSAVDFVGGGGDGGTAQEQEQQQQQQQRQRQQEQQEGQEENAGPGMPALDMGGGGAVSWQEQWPQSIGNMLDNDAFFADGSLDVYHLLSNQLPS